MRTTLLRRAALCALPMLSGQVFAADTADYFSLEEIIVTATKREENLQKVPTAVSVLSESDLRDAGSSSLTDVAKLVPGLQVVVTNAASSNYYSIRGATQNDFAEHEESPVAIYMDGVYISQPSGTAALLFDTARVEVLRGPQGTLFGRNATAGLVHYISAAPTAELSGYLQVKADNKNARNMEGAISREIVPGLSARLSVAGDFSGPWMTNTIGKDPNDIDSRAGRLQLQFKPNEALDATLKVQLLNTKVKRAGFYVGTNVYSDPAAHGAANFVPPNVDVWNNGQSCPGCDQLGYRRPDSYDYYTDANDYPGYLDNKIRSGTLTVKYDLGGVNLTSISDYTQFKKNYAEDADGRPLVESIFWTGINTKQFSQEIRFDNGTSERLRWVAGAYFLNINGDYLFGAGLAGQFIGSPVDAGLLNTYNLKSRSWAAFAQSDFDIVEKLTLTLGFRWSDDRKEFDYINYGLDGPYPDSPISAFVTPTVVNRATIGDDALLKEHDWSGRAVLSYRFNDRVMTYLSWNKGLKPGGFNAPFFAFSDPKLYRFHKETLYATELGVKSEYLDGRARVNADVFYYDYDGYQAFNTINGIDNFLDNLKAEMYGGELEFALRPVRELNLHMGVSALSSKVKSFLMTDGSRLTRQSAQAPKFNVTGGLDYTWSLGNLGSLVAATDFEYTTKFYRDLENAPAAEQDSLWLQGARLKYTTAEGHYSIQASVDNLFDKQYPLYVINNNAFGWGSYLPAKPRTFGIQLTYNL